MTEYEQLIKQKIHGNLACGRIIETTKGEKFKCTGFMIGKLTPESEKGEYKILQRLYPNGTLGEKEFYYTDEQWKTAMLEDKIKFVN